MGAVRGCVRTKHIVNGVKDGGADSFTKAWVTLSEAQEIVHVDVHIGQRMSVGSQGVVG